MPPAGEIEKPCIVILEEDAIYEEEEEFRLVLGTPKSTSTFGASIGEQKETLVKIKDEEDSEFIRCFGILCTVKMTLACLLQCPTPKYTFTSILLFTL